MSLLCVFVTRFRKFEIICLIQTVPSGKSDGNFNKNDVILTSTTCAFVNFSQIFAISRNIWRALKFVEKFDACLNAQRNCSYERAFFSCRSINKNRMFQLTRPAWILAYTSAASQHGTSRRCIKIRKKGTFAAYARL